MSSNSRSKCMMCNCRPSTVSCEGCGKKFCMDCIREHQKKLSNEFDMLCHRRNELMERINGSMHANVTNPYDCMKEIERWKKDMHENINRIASQAEIQVQQFFSDSKKKFRSKLDRISQVLQEKGKSGGYHEHDLREITQKLNEVDDMVKKLVEKIQIDTTNSKNINWNSLLVVKLNDSYQIPSSRTSVSPSTISRSSFSSIKSFYLKNTIVVIVCILFSVPNRNGIVSRENTLFDELSTQNIVYKSQLTSHRPRTYTCIGCKQLNTINENGPNFCSTCHYPAKI